MWKKWMMMGALVALIAAAGCDDSPPSPDVTVSEFSSEIEECLKFKARGECESSGCRWDLGVESWELGEALQSSPMCTPKLDCSSDAWVVSDASDRCWKVSGACLLPGWSEEGAATEACADDENRARNDRTQMCAKLRSGEACEEAECTWSDQGTKLLESGCKEPFYQCLGSLDIGCLMAISWAITPDGSCVKANSICGFEGWEYESEEAEACREAYEAAVCK